MAIKAILDKTSYDALSADLKTLYKAEGDKFVIDAEGLDDHPFAASLKKALEAERKTKTEAAKELAELKASLGDLDPAAAREALKKIKDLEEKALLGEIPEKFKKQFDEAVAVRVKSISDDFETQKKAFNKQIDTEKANVSTLTARLSELVIDNEVRAAAAKLGFQDWAVEDAVLHAKQVYRMKDGKPIPMKGEEIIYGKNPNEPKPIAEWLTDKVAEKPGWVKGSGGGGAENTDVKREGNVHKITREKARDVQAYRSAEDAAKKAGATLQIVD